jgi:hypothetical protein
VDDLYERQKRPESLTAELGGGELLFATEFLLVARRRWEAPSVCREAGRSHR